MTDLTPVQTDHAAILRALRLDPTNPDHAALLLICDRYGLDPLLKHVVLIQGRPYVTRDGYLHIAHRGGQLDGIEIIDEGEEPAYWWARVSVYRKDMGRPFTYRGRYPKQGAGNKQYGPEMAVKCAEVAALRRAFNVSGVGAADERWDEPEAAAVPLDPEPLDGWDSYEQMRDAHRDLAQRASTLPETTRHALTEWKEANGLTGWPVPRAQWEAMDAEVARLGSELEEPF